MTPAEVTTFLRAFNEWRRGDEDIPQFDPREVGEAIDAAVKMIGRLQKIDSAWQNFMNVSGLHNTEIAYRRLVAALEKSK